MGLRTVGVEEEFLLVDSAAVPRPVGNRVVTGTGRGRRAAAEGIEHELQQEQAETGTRVHVDLDELRANLIDRRSVLDRSAREQGVRIVAVATSPLPVDPTVTDEPRYRRMTEQYGATVREELVCGCHVHIGIDSRAQGTAVLNAIQPWLSVLLALSVNSPFWQGRDSGYASYRRMVWDRWPWAGPTAPFADEADYDRAVADLVGSGVLLDEAMVYFDARLSAKYPTLEVRVADVCTDVDDAVLLAALARALVTTTAAAPAAGAARPPRIELLRAAAWRAARSGLAGDLVDPTTGRAIPAASRVQQLVDLVEPALREQGDLDRVESSVHRLLTRGTGAARQIDTYRRAGTMAAVVLDAADRTVGLPARLTVEVADPGDGQIVELLDALTAELAEGEYTEAETFGYSVDQLVRHGVHLVAARVGDRAVGIGGVELQGDGRAELKRFFVSPGERGTGAADAIMAALVAHATANHIRELRLETGDRQRAARAFYRRHGFVEVPRFSPYESSATSVCMLRPLPGEG